MTGRIVKTRQTSEGAAAMKSNVPTPSMGILNANRTDPKFQLTRHAPSGDLAFFVKHYWIVSWDLTGQDPYMQHVVPNPCVNMVIEKKKTGIFGPAKSKFSYFIQGKGLVFGVKFRPGGFYPFIKQPVSGLTEHPVKLTDVFQEEDEAFENAVLRQEDAPAMVELAETLIRRSLPQKDDTITLINEIIARINEDREITKVDEICESFSINKRQLQRVFDQYVGVSPKWVIRLYRIQNAAEAIDLGHTRDWPTLSAGLGYYDQSHFIKDFKTIIGQTPEEYVRQLLN
jgi:AraC-like DNA-binding protein